MKPLIKTPCDYCGKPVLTTVWERPVFCHDDCAEGWLVEMLLEQRLCPHHSPFMCGGALRPADDTSPDAALFKLGVGE